MDPDEALARMLQEEELRAAGGLQGLQLAQTARQATATAAAAAAAGGGGGRAADIAAFESRLRMLRQVALGCESPALQERARAVMPLARLRAAAEDAAALTGRLGGEVEAPAVEDELARGLLAWFKMEFFTWVDTLPCSSCGCTTRHAGMGAASPDDLAGGAGRVELHACPACGTTNRFPRYNDPGRLLQPGCRRGRCGEWANAFLLCCRAAGLTARYVSDWADHVWTEYYSHRMRRWVHLDSCEAAYDKPLLYESGWGKEVLYVVAAGKWGIADVTQRYTARWRQHVAPRRTLVSERWLARTLDGMTDSCRAGWPAPRRLLWLGRDAAERLEFLRQRLGLRPAGQQQEALPGRLTGSLAWREQRGETGAASSSAPTGPAARPPTSYRLAPDGPGRLPPVFAAAGRLSGGAVRAAGHNEAHEVAERLFDGRTATKWLDFGGGGAGGSSWVEYRMPNDLQPVFVTAYDLVAANDCPERDPAEWRLEGVMERDWQQGRQEQWTPLDARSGVRFPARLAPLSFRLGAASPPCRRLRLSITATADPRVANSVQLACWNLYGSSSGSNDSSSSNSSDSDGRVKAPSTGCSSDNGGGAEVGSGHSGEADAVDAALQALQALRLREGGGAAGLDPAAVSLLARLLGNVRRSPHEAKLRKVRCAKVRPLLLPGPLSELLLRFVGFRPLIMPSEDGLADAGQPGVPGVPAGEDVFLVLPAEADGGELRRIERVLEVLPPQR